jgi:hypothetical protein
MDSENKKESKNYETFLGREISKHLQSTASEILHQKTNSDSEDSEKE